MLISDFARTKGARDKKKRTRKQNIIAGIKKGVKIGAVAGGGLTAAAHIANRKKIGEGAKQLGSMYRRIGLSPGHADASGKVLMGMGLTGEAAKQAGKAAILGGAVGATTGALQPARKERKPLFKVSAKHAKQIEKLSKGRLKATSTYSESYPEAEFARTKGAKDKTKRKARSAAQLIKEDEKLKYAAGRGAKAGGAIGAGLGALQGGMYGTALAGPVGTIPGAVGGALAGGAGGAITGAAGGAWAKRMEQRYRKKLKSKQKA